MNEFVYNDFASWLIENDRLIKTLKNRKTQLYDRYENVFLVVEHIYNLKVEQQTVDEDHYKVFSIGFHYLFNQFESISLLLNNNFDGDIEQLIEFDTSILLFLLATEIQDDIFDSLEEEAHEVVKPIKELENEIYEYLTKKEHVPKEIFNRLDNKIVEVYTEYEQIYSPIYSIYYDIAEELNLID